MYKNVLMGPERCNSGGILHRTQCSHNTVCQRVLPSQLLILNERELRSASLGRKITVLKQQDTCIISATDFDLLTKGTTAVVYRIADALLLGEGLTLGLSQRHYSGNQNVYKDFTLRKLFLVNYCKYKV